MSCRVRVCPRRGLIFSFVYLRLCIRISMAEHAADVAIDDLPDDIMRMIFFHFDLIALFCLAGINRRWHKMIEDLARSGLSKQDLTDTVARMRVILRCAAMFPGKNISSNSLFKHITAGDFTIESGVLERAGAFLFMNAYKKCTKSSIATNVKQIARNIALECVECGIRFVYGPAGGVFYKRRKGCICTGRICNDCFEKPKVRCCIEVYACGHFYERTIGENVIICTKCKSNSVCKQCSDRHRVCPSNGNLCADCMGPLYQYGIDVSSVIACDLCVHYCVCDGCGLDPPDRKLQTVPGRGLLCSKCVPRAKCKYYHSDAGVCVYGNRCRFAHD